MPRFRFDRNPTPRARPTTRALLTVAAAIVAVACREPPAAAPTTTVEEDAGPEVSAVDAALVFVDCPDAPRLKGHAAEDAIHKLVDACTRVPGGEVRFAAVFAPGGRIEFDAADGGTPDDTIPLCVLRHDLSHKLPVQKRCRVEVRMREQRLGGAKLDVGDTLHLEQNGCWQARVTQLTEGGVRVRYPDGSERAYTVAELKARQCVP